MTMIQHCCFCSKKFKSTKPVNIYFDDSPLAEGHLLLYTKYHYPCVGALEDNTLKEFCLIKDQTTKVLKKTYGAVCSFEHGNVGSCFSSSVNRLCHHCHFHLIPTDVDVAEELKSDFFHVKLNRFEEIKTYYERFGEYLYFESNNGEMSFFPVNTQIEPHLLRTLIAKKLNSPEMSNWETYTNPEAVLAAKKKVENLINF